MFIRYLTACYSAMFLQSLLILTYRDHFLNIARLTHLLYKLAVGLTSTDPVTPHVATVNRHSAQLLSLVVP